MVAELLDQTLPLLVSRYLTECGGEAIQQQPYVISMPNGLKMTLTPEFHAKSSNYAFGKNIH